MDKPWYTKCDRFGKNVRKMYKHENVVKKMKAEPINNIVINFLGIGDNIIIVSKATQRSLGTDCLPYVMIHYRCSSRSMALSD